MMRFMQTYSSGVEKISALVGKVASWLTVALMLSIGYEVLMRYGFRSPTLWSFDISYMLGGTIYVLGLAWVLKEDRNIRVDIISCRFSPKTQLIINIVLTIFLFLPMAVMLLKISWERMIHSWRIMEKASYTIWYPPIYPLRTVVFLAVLFWLLQGIATLYRNFENLKGNRP